jgi:hypothetical protein
MTDQPLATPSTSAPILPVTPTGTPAVAPAGGAKLQASPLDVLDQILNDAQSKSLKAEEEKQKEEEQKIQDDLARQKAEDERKLQEERVRLEEVKQSPQYHAMVEQKVEAVEEKEEKAKELDGMEIVQLDHQVV